MEQIRSCAIMNYAVARTCMSLSGVAELQGSPMRPQQSDNTCFTAHTDSRDTPSLFKA